MEQTVYADLYFMINLSMDFLCFFLTAKILSIRLYVRRALIASALGGVYAVAALFLSVGKLTALIIDMAVCVCLCLLAFARKKELRSALMYTPVYIAVSMALGGFMTALFNLFNRLEIPLPESDSDGISVWLFAIFAIAGGTAVLLGGRFFAKRSARKNAEVTVAHNGRSVCVRALCDSGNLLRDPLGNAPCVVIERSLLKGVIPDEVLAAAEKNDISRIDKLRGENMARVRIIPARTATGEGLLIAFRADLVEVDSGKGKRAVDALVIASEIGNTADGSRALLPPELLS